ncbi:hypothetical protein GCM10009504_21980 [Pseudomonas laurentiana]|nr:hypothetical protein GCM10009504_21980 [Pseudomonas laurentiana]
MTPAPPAPSGADLYDGLLLEQAGFFFPAVSASVPPSKGHGTAPGGRRMQTIEGRIQTMLAVLEI